MNNVWSKIVVLSCSIAMFETTVVAMDPERINNVIVRLQAIEFLQLHVWNFPAHTDESSCIGEAKKRVEELLKHERFALNEKYTRQEVHQACKEKVRREIDLRELAQPR